MRTYLTTVSRRYAKEIQTPEYGCGLEGVIRNRADRLVGILNGVDYAVWSPEADTLIAQKYSAHNLDGKKACKKDLLAAFQLPRGESGPASGRHRLALRGSEGIRSDRADRGRLMKENLALVALGTGAGIRKVLRAWRPNIRRASA